MLRGKGPHKPDFAYDIVRIHSLMIYTSLIEYNIVGDTKALLLRCFLFISKLKSRDFITTGQYINYQTFSNLQFRPLLKNLFHSIHIEFGDPSGATYPFGLWKLLDLFWYLEKLALFIFNEKHVTRWLLQDKKKFHTIEVLIDNLEEDSMHLREWTEDQQFHFYVIIASRLENKWVLIWWFLLRQKL